MRSLRGLACAAVLLAPALLAAAQAPKPAHADAKDSGCRHGRPLYVANGPLGKLACFDPAPRSEEPAPGKGAVIYNGNQKQTHIFASSDPRPPVKNLTPEVVGIVAAESKSRAKSVVVGISSDMHESRPVVVNVASAGSNAQPVVVGIASSGFQPAGPVTPVAVGMSPRPAKRPPYRPAALDAQ